MENIKRIVKLKYQDLAKRADFPQSFDDLIEKTKVFVPITEPKKRYQFINKKTNQEVNNKEDFDLLSQNCLNENLTTILINIVDEEEEEQPEKNINKIIPETNFLEIEEEKPLLSNTNEDVNKDIKEMGGLKDSNLFSSSELANLSEIVSAPKTTEPPLLTKEEEVKEPITSNINEKGESVPGAEDTFDEEKIKEDVRNLVESKIKTLQESLIQDIYKNIQTQVISASQLKMQKDEPKQKEKVIHKHVICDKCGKKDIEGIRYKCACCKNFDFCENCYILYGKEHGNDHIFIKIRKPITNSKEFNSKIKSDIKYKNEGFNYIAEPLEIKLKTDCDNFVQQISLKNNGSITWKQGNVFKCLEQSEIKGKDYQLDCKVNPNSVNHIEIIFEDINKMNLPEGKKEFDVYYQMFNSDNESFGNITKFKAILVK